MNQSPFHYLRCFDCGKKVSTEFFPIPTDTPDGGLIVRAWICCPECLEKSSGTLFSVVTDRTCGERHNHLLNCKTCQALAQTFFAQKAGSTITEKKKKSSKLNGMKGGRPKK